ncbi:DUF6919 domain-containing protein [Streptomyces albidoflavus]
MHTPITLPSMSRADQRTWEAARTVAALGELMARWLEGTLESRPGCEARCRPEDEMLPLVPTLAALCRAGYITTGSQPGIVGLGVNGGWEQHAWVDLVVTDRALLDRLVAIVTEGGMLVRVHDHRHGAPAASAEQPVVATTCDGQIHMEVGDRMRAIDMPRLWPGLHPALYEEITHGWHVSVVAPTVGAEGDGLLWPLLDRVPDTAEYEDEPEECRCGTQLGAEERYCGPACEAEAAASLAAQERFLASYQRYLDWAFPALADLATYAAGLDAEELAALAALEKESRTQQPDLWLSRRRAAGIAERRSAQVADAAGPHLHRLRRLGTAARDAGLAVLTQGLLPDPADAERLAGPWLHRKHPFPRPEHRVSWGTDTTPRNGA